MAYKTVQTLDADVTITIGGVDKKTGKKNRTSAEGFYLGKRVVAGSKYGDSNLYVFQTAEGNLGVWGKTDLDRKMGSAKLGQMTLIEYKGMKPSKNGDMHTYQVAQDADSSIDVSDIASEPTEESEDFPSEGYVGNDEDESDEDPDLDDAYEAPVAAAVQQESAAARKARVQAMLKKNQTK